jgi:hypothetical protein
MTKGTLLLIFVLVGLGSGICQMQIRVSNCDIRAAVEHCQDACTISVSAGTCHLEGPITWAGTGKRINLECAGRNQTVLTCSPGGQCIDVDSHARIAHCDLRGTGIPEPTAIINGGSGATDVVIEDNIIEQAADIGVNTGGGALRWTIRNNLIQNNLGDGIFLASGTSDSVVADNVIINNVSNGIDCNGSGNTFHGNISNSNGLPGGPIDRNGILISGILNGSSANNNTVSGNETNYNGGPGITIRADLGTTANYNTVSGNVSHDNSGTNQNGDGIGIDGSDLGTYIGNTVVGNTVYHNQRDGINVDGENATMMRDNVISSNVVIANGFTGILLGNPKVQDTLVTNNIVTDNVAAQITDLDTTHAVIAGNKDGSSPSAYVIKNDLVANTWKFSSDIVIDKGVSSDGSGLKHQFVSTGVVGPLVSKLVSLAWTRPFPDANYTPQCSVVDPTGGPFGIRIHHIYSFNPAQVFVEIVNDDGRFYHQGNLYCLGIHQ